MAEYCQKCSKKYGFHWDGLPDSVCEGCGKSYRGRWYYHFWDDVKEMINKLFNF